LTKYVLEAHERVLDETRDMVVRNYRGRVEETVKLLTAGEGGRRPRMD
jgi:hypothetical protein